VKTVFFISVSKEHLLLTVLVVCGTARLRAFANSRSVAADASARVDTFEKATAADASGAESIQIGILVVLVFVL
jgi:hypothetical protein